MEGSIIPAAVETGSCPGELPEYHRVRVVSESSLVVGRY
jgi:hypothetical protein